MKKEKQHLNDKEQDELFYNSVASSNDCTGAVPARPKTEAESESYSEIQNIPLQKPKHIKGLNDTDRKVE